MNIFSGFFFAISKRFGDPGKIGTYIGYIHFVKVENLESDPKKKWVIGLQ